MNSAIAFASSVFPTPDGPTKMKEPMGRLGSLRPERAFRIARETALTASSWLTTVLWSSFSSWSSRWLSSFSSRVRGTPVILLTTSAMTSSSTTASIWFMRSRQSCWTFSFCLRSFSAWSRRSAARS